MRTASRGTPLCRCLPGQEQAAPCVLRGRARAGPGVGTLGVLRDNGARVLLGVVADSGGTCHRFVEIWVQAAGYRRRRCCAALADALTNRVLDERWARQHRAFAAADAGAVITTGWESRDPPPTLIDIANLRPVGLPSNEQGTGWRRCEDRCAASRRGASLNSGSLDRYLYQPKLGSPAHSSRSPRCAGERSHPAARRPARQDGRRSV